MPLGLAASSLRTVPVRLGSMGGSQVPPPVACARCLLRLRGQGGPDRARTRGEAGRSAGAQGCVSRRRIGDMRKDAHRTGGCGTRARKRLAPRPSAARDDAGPSRLAAGRIRPWGATPGVSIENRPRLRIAPVAAMACGASRRQAPSLRCNAARLPPLDPASPTMREFTTHEIFRCGRRDIAGGPKRACRSARLPASADQFRSSTASPENVSRRTRPLPPP